MPRTLRLACSWLCVAALMAVAAAQTKDPAALKKSRPAAAQKPRALVITGATLIDGTGAPPVRDAIVVIRGERIVATGPRPRVQIPRSAWRTDARGKWVIPGLVDAHVHFFQSGGLYTRPDVIDLRSRVPYAKELATIRDRLPYTFTRYLCSGITSAVDVGGPMWNFQVRELAARTIDAPRVAVAGPLISSYVPPALETDDPAIIRVSTPEEARGLADKELAEKPDLVKIWFIRRPDMKLEDFVPIVEATVKESHARGVRVAVHATELSTAKAAVHAGADVLVHSVMDKPVDNEFIELVKSRAVIYTTTLVVLEGYYNVLRQRAQVSDFDRQCGDPNVIATWGDLGKIPENERPPIPAQMSQVPERMKNSLANLKRMQDAGAIVAPGTDAGNIGTLHGPSLHREFELMAEAGLTPMQILVAATRNAARVFAREPEMGTIAPGKLADLVILDADPLADIRNTRRIYAVIKGGRSMHRLPTPAPAPPP
jgi:imidazolonepropionase-like amidohydrolase